MKVFLCTVFALSLTIVLIGLGMACAKYEEVSAIVMTIAFLVVVGLIAQLTYNLVGSD